MIRGLIIAAALGAVLGVSPAAHAKRAEIRPGQYFGITATGCPEKSCDDFIGFPVERKGELLDMTGANLNGATVAWGKCEPNDPGAGPSHYDWSSLDDSELANDPRFTLMIGVKLDNEWAKDLRTADKDRYYTLVERFCEAAARECRRRWGVRAKFYHVPGNEPSLKDEKSLPAGYNWYTWYMEPAIHIYNGVKRASAENQVVVGALVVGDKDHVGALYAGGLKGHFDVLDIHAYAPGGDDGYRMHVGLDQIIEAHQAMADHGDGDKKIYLGEGWSLWPKPDALYRKGPDEPVTPAMIEHYRQCLLRGYRNLVTPREGFDPAWVMGARYFILNDFWQKMHWKERAVPRYNDQGKLEGWVLDGYWIPYEKNALEPVYRDWGLVGFDGTPKSPELLTDFPPYLPKDSLVVTIEPAAAQNAAVGHPYRVTVTTTNGEKSAFSDLRFALTMRKWWNDKNAPPPPKITPLLPEPPTTAAPGRSVSGQFLVEFGDQHRGKRIRLVGELQYTWEGKPYYADAWLWVNVQ
jgi:hypothetical protein